MANASPYNPFNKNIEMLKKIPVNKNCCYYSALIYYIRIKELAYYLLLYMQGGR